MKIVTCTGLYGTGSSAITDLLMDCGNAVCKGNFEIRFLHDPCGVSDLDYNIVENPNRHNTSHAIKKFKKYIDFLSNGKSKHYDVYFNRQFKKLVYEYLDSIVLKQYKSCWHWDVIEKGRVFYFLSRSTNKMIGLLRRIFRIKNTVNHDLGAKKEIAYLGVDNPSIFYSSTKTLISKLATAINPKNKEFVFMDQLVPPSNFPRYNRYLPEGTKIILVDRDPRDIFTLEKEIWHGTIVPCYDVHLFIAWFKWTRRLIGDLHLSQNVLKIRFEDLVYDFDATRKKIFDFIGMDESFYHKKAFDPSVSIKNTQLFDKYPHNRPSIEVIERELGDYCYPFPD